MDKMLKIAVAGTGYVGLSIATLLAQHHEVCAIDVIPAKVDLINRRKSPIRDEYIEKYLAEKELKLTATLDPAQAYSGADFVVIAAPTNYDSRTQHFDTSAVEAVIQLVMQYNPNAVMVIKSTIPVGYTVSVREKFGSSNIIFSPEFLRESKALYDNLYPSRIIIGTDLNDPRLVEAAQDLGAGRVQVFRRVIFPLSVPGVISGIMMVFIPSISTFAISKLLGGGMSFLLGDLIEMQFLGSAYNPHLGSAISLMMLLLVIVAMLIMNRFGDGEEGAVMM